jgi:hypothetical protein
MLAYVRLTLMPATVTTSPSQMMNRRLWTVLLVFCWCLPLMAAQTDYAAKIAPLIDPAKLSTLGKRGANSRVQKYVYWLEMARKDKQDPGKVIDDALRSVGVKKAAAELTRTAMLRNLDIAQKLGCLDTAGLDEMKRGKAPTVQKGPYKGDQLSVDYIIPRDVCSELDCVIANLELMPLRMNESKNDKIGARQVDLSKKFHLAGLLSDKGWRAVSGTPR